jgi:hypothetical protein
MKTADGFVLATILFALVKLSHGTETGNQTSNLVHKGKGLLLFGFKFP